MSMIKYGKNDPRNDDDPPRPAYPYREHLIQGLLPENLIPTRIKRFTIKIPILGIIRWFKKRK